MTNNNSLSEDYCHLDNHIRKTTDTPGFKPFTILLYLDIFFNGKLCIYVIYQTLARVFDHVSKH